MALRFTIAVALGATLLACGSEVTVFPPGLEPLMDEVLDPPAGACPQEFLTDGTDGGRHDTVLGRGYIRAPITDVWAAYRDPAVGADRAPRSRDSLRSWAVPWRLL